MIQPIDGLVGGLIATIAMTVTMRMVGDGSSPPTTDFLAQYVGDGEPTDYAMPGMVLHLVYGSVSGAILVIAVGLAGIETLATPVTGILAGLLFGIVLFVGGAVFWMKMVLDMAPEPREVVVFLVVHLTYGLVLGAWLGYGGLGLVVG